MNMVTKARERVSPVDVLQMDVEYIDVKFYQPTGERNDLGEELTTLETRATDVKASLDPMTGVPAYWGGLDIQQVKQGIAENKLFLLTLNKGSVSIDENDIVEDVDGVQYKVYSVNDWQTHVECIVRKL